MEFDQLKLLLTIVFLNLAIALAALFVGLGLAQRVTNLEEIIKIEAKVEVKKMSNSLKISKTPWRISEWGAVVDADGVVVCPVPCKRDHEIVRGNARLIVLSPDMHKELEMIANYIDDNADFVRRRMGDIMFSAVLFRFVERIRELLRRIDEEDDAEEGK